MRLAGRLALVGIVLGLAPASADAASVTVSLQFDDGIAEHALAAQILEARGLRATFYVNSARLDRPGYLSGGQVDALAARGHEIGGHTLTHKQLPTLPQRSHHERHPLGGRVQRVPVGRIHPPAGADAHQSVRTTTTLATIQSSVIGARSHGGGWIGILMHHVCDGCSTNAITSAALAALADWLVAQPEVRVRTVDQVIGGPLLGAVPGPPLPAPSSARNVLANPSLEARATPTAPPDCWSRSAYLGSDGAWATVNDAHWAAAPSACKRRVSTPARSTVSSSPRTTAPVPPASPWGRVTRWALGISARRGHG